MSNDLLLDSPFYRVTSRAIILDEQDRLIVVQDKNGSWQMPGGGWEHDESYLECLQREVQEELGLLVTEITGPSFCYQQLDRRGYYSLRIAAPVLVDGWDFAPGDDMVTYKAVTKAEFTAMEFNRGEGPIQDYVDQIWSPGERG